MFCSKCGKEISDEAVICPNCGVPTSNYKGAPTKSKSNFDESLFVKYMSISALVCSFFCSIVGLILGLIYRPKAVAIDDESSRKRCTASIWISAGIIIVSIIIGFVYSIVAIASI